MARRDLNDWFWHVTGDFGHLTSERVPKQVPVATNRFWQPRVDVVENDRVILIKAELAGVRIEDMHLSYSPPDHCIMLRGVRHEEDLVEMGRAGIHQLEVFYGEFERDIPLPNPCQVDANRIQASFRNGFLFVIVPKVGAAP